MRSTLHTLLGTLAVIAILTFGGWWGSQSEPPPGYAMGAGR